MSWKRSYKIIVLLAVFLLSAIALFIADPIAQDLAYHRFSDKRAFLGVPHFMDVISNLPFVVIGILGLRVARKSFKKKTMSYFVMTFTLFIGVTLTGFGSAFYHYAPNNFTLIFDRLPMVLVFTAFFGTIIYDYVDRRVGASLFYALLFVGVYSILYWYYTEIIGQGDLRMYAFVQFFPIVATPLILAFYHRDGLYTKELVYVFIAYAIAKVFEHFDTQVFDLSGALSGHTVKHFFSALAVWFMLKVYEKQLGRH